MFGNGSDELFLDCGEFVWCYFCSFPKESDAIILVSGNNMNEYMVNGLSCNCSGGKDKIRSFRFQHVMDNSKEFCCNGEKPGGLVLVHLLQGAVVVFGKDENMSFGCRSDIEHCKDRIVFIDFFAFEFAFCDGAEGALHSLLLFEEFKLFGCEFFDERREFFFLFVWGELCDAIQFFDEFWGEGIFFHLPECSSDVNHIYISDASNGFDVFFKGF